MLRIGCAVILAAAANTAMASVSVERSYLLTRESVDLPSGSFSTYEYDLQSGTELIFILQTAHWRRGSFRIWLLDAPNYARMSDGETFDYLRSGTGLVDREARISFAVPESGSYFFVLDNSESGAVREIDVYAYVRTEHASNDDERAIRQYQGYYDRLAGFIDIEAIEIQVRRCGESNAFAVGRLVVICRELDELLHASAPAGVPLFVFLHEISHSLMAMWGYRSVYTDQVMADRLAVTFFQMIDDSDLAEQAAQWFLDTPVEIQQEVSADAFSLRRSRSRRIADWLRNETDLGRGWTRRIVVPRMSTPALESLVGADHLHRKTRRRMQRELSARE